MRLAMHVAWTGEKRYAHNLLVGKYERKRPVWRCRHRREDNIRIDLKEVGCDIVDRIHLAYGRDQWSDIVNTVMESRVP